MFTTVDKAIVAIVMGILTILANFGVLLPTWLNEQTVITVISVAAPILVYLVPNKKPT